MSLPRMSWHIGDYKRDTGHLRTVEHGAYFLLCMHYWATGGLPDNDQQLATISGMTEEEWRTHKPVLQALFKARGRWKHKRVKKEMALAQAKYEKRVAAGRLGGKAKAKARKAASNARANAYQPITDNPNPKELVRGGGGGADRIVSDAAFKLSRDIGKICGYAEPIDWPPGWSQATYRIQTWLNAGWTEDQILAACNAAMAAKTDGPPSTINYFEKPIARWIAKQAKPLPRVVTSAQETIHAQADQHHPAGAYGASKDRFRAAYAKLAAADDAANQGDNGGPEIVRPVAAAGRD